MADYKNVGLDPVGTPHAYEKQEVGKPSRNAAHSLVLFMTTLTGVMSCGTAGPLGSVPGMWTH